jgi:hypothetical protein
MLLVAVIIVLLFFSRLEHDAQHVGIFPYPRRCRCDGHHIFSAGPAAAGLLQLKAPLTTVAAQIHKSVMEVTAVFLWSGKLRRAG